MNDNYYFYKKHFQGYLQPLKHVLITFQPTLKEDIVQGDKTATAPYT